MDAELQTVSGNPLRHTAPNTGPTKGPLSVGTRGPPKTSGVALMMASWEPKRQKIADIDRPEETRRRRLGKKALVCYFKNGFNVVE